MRLVAIALLASACQPPPPAADPEFSDAARYAFREFETQESARLAFAVRALEEQLYLSMDLESDASADRAMTPEHLTEDDVANIPHPDYSPEAGVPVAVGGLSAFVPDEHLPYVLLPDQTPVEPGSPDLYTRNFVDGTEVCWPDRTCEILFTSNHLIKENALLTVEYDLYKDYRWVDLNLPDPSTVPEGEQPVNPGEKRWAFVARSYTDQVWVGDQGANEIQLSFSFEVWLSRDGSGWIRPDGGQSVDPEDGSTWTTDSSGPGALRMMALWSRTNLNDSFDEPTIANTIRMGIDDIFAEQEAWLAAR